MVRLIALFGGEFGQNGFPFLARTFRKSHLASLQGLPFIEQADHIQQTGAFRIPAGDGQQVVQSGERLVHGRLGRLFTPLLRFQGFSPFLQIIQLRGVFFRQQRQFRLLVGV